MGYYINPKTKTKEEFLVREGILVSRQSASEHKAGQDGVVIVALVNNGPFKAAAIGYTDEETKYFLDSRLHGDQRPVEFYKVPIAKIIEADPSLANVLGELS